MTRKYLQDEAAVTLSKLIPIQAGQVWYDPKWTKFNTILGDTWCFITRVDTKRDKIHFRYIHTGDLYNPNAPPVEKTFYSRSTFIANYAPMLHREKIIEIYGLLAKALIEKNKVEWLMSRSGCPLTRDDLGLILLSEIDD